MAQERTIRESELPELIGMAMQLQESSSASLDEHRLSEREVLQIAENIMAIISQRLLPRKGQKGRVAAVEVMVATLRIREYITQPEKTSFIQNAIEEGREQYGMQSFDQHLKELFARGMIDLDTAMKAATRPSDLILKLRSEGFKIDQELMKTRAADTDVGGGSTELTLG